MPSDDPPSTPDTRLLRRCSALLNALRDGPLDRPALLERVGHTAYPGPVNARRMIDRDITFLQMLGIEIERTSTRPPRFTLRGGTPAFTPNDLRTLALIRDTFGPHHPQSSQVQSLLARLTASLTEQEQRRYHQRQVSQAPIQPAIDYTPYAPLIAALEEAISTRQRLTFFYQSSQHKPPKCHKLVEPHEIEYYERHFYFVGYSYNSRQTHDFRIDRIRYDDTFQRVDRLPPGLEHQRTRITFRYRLAAALARGEISQRFEQQRVVEQLPNGDVIIEAQGRSDFFIRRTLLKYAGNAELLWPEWLRKQIVREVEEIAKLYRENP